MRYFIQFTAWATLGLIYATFVLVVMFYSQNVERGVGAQGIGDLIIINPFKAYKQVAIMMKGIFTASLPHSEKLKLIDGALLGTILGALAFASSNGIAVITNLREQ